MDGTGASEGQLKDQGTISRLQPTPSSRLSLNDDDGGVGRRRNIVYISGDAVSYGRAADLVERRFPGVEFARELGDAEVLAGEPHEGPGGNVEQVPRSSSAPARAPRGRRRRRLNHERGIELEDLETYLGRMETPPALRS
ncbi:hypothetical protein CTA2_8587 [Colletotrichum tanaceti]|uniref:Uncharacterized protein n=1 Tax=Colletotrichum tanaceti TaxID=1306861 RepID=A0A4U6XN58_9PEZI|nr:hypothetical protein CTA2_8587 [Colletotrichum tanaceti]TKW57150.1 hypothetical protein CTA1_9041 [Colletotrichum tanaceti]